MSSDGCSRLVAVDVIAQEDVGERIQTHAQTHSYTEVLVRWLLLCPFCVVYSSMSRTLKTPWTDVSLWMPEAGIQLA